VLPVNSAGAVNIHFFISLIYGKLRTEIDMPGKSSRPRQRKTKVADGFRISPRPVVRSSNEQQNATHEVRDAGVLRARGAPMLFAVAPDPRTIFTCWSIDWSAVFATTVPVNKQVRIRVHRLDGKEEKRVSVEPMAGYCYVRVSGSSSSYHVEIGYYQPPDIWNSVATCEKVEMPLDKGAKFADVDLATIPFHLKFQHLLDLFGASTGDSLAEIVSRFQTRALRNGKRHRRKSGEQKILRAMGISLREIADARCTFLHQGASETLQQLTEGLLSFSSASPSRGFDSDDWPSARS
jgi:hypothetical protein